MPEDNLEQSQPVEQGAEKKALSTPDAQDARNANASQIKAIQESNPDKSDGSAGGDKKVESIRIESDGKVIAARVMPEDSITREELKELANRHAGGYPWAQSVLKKFEVAENLPFGSARDEALARAQDMADLMARRGPYALGKETGQLLASSVSSEEQKPDKKAEYKVSDSYSMALGLAVAKAESAEEADKIQGLFSINYMIQKGQKAIAASQKPADEQVLIASNITPSAPHLKTGEMLDAKTDATNAQSNDGEILAGKPNGYEDPVYVPRYFERRMFPLRGQESELLLECTRTDPRAWEQAFEAFPDLKNKYGLSEVETTQMMKAIVRNELHWYDEDDKKQDITAGKGKTEWTKTIGYAQITPTGIAEFAKAYPELKAFFEKRGYKGEGHEAKALLDPECVPMIVAAKFLSLCQHYESTTDKLPSNYVEKGTKINPRTLAYGYNADVYYNPNNSKNPDFHANTSPIGAKDIEKLKGCVKAFPTASAKALNASQHLKNVENQLKVIRQRL